MALMRFTLMKKAAINKAAADKVAVPGFFAFGSVVLATLYPVEFAQAQQGAPEIINEPANNAQSSGTEPNLPVELEALEERLKNKEREEAELIKTAEERAKEITNLRYRLIETANSIQDSEREISRIERELKRLAREEADVTQKLAAEDGSLSEVLAALQAFELSRPPALLVSPDDANRAARAAMLLSEAAPALSEKAKSLRTLVKRLSDSRQGLIDQQNNYERTASSLVARREVLSELLQRKEDERDVAARLAATAQKETASLAARATSLKGVVSRLQRLAHAVTPRIKPPRSLVAIAPGSPETSDPSNTGKATGIEIIDGAEAGTIARIIPDGEGLSTGKTPAISQVPANAPFQPARTFISAKGSLRPPVVGRLAGKFGQEIDGERLDGIRLQTRDRSIVTAPYESRIVFAQWWGTIGNMLVLDVGSGYHVLLMGVGKFLVDAGQVVNAGEPLAEMTAQANILDIQIRKNGEPINPAPWLGPRDVEESAF